MNDCQAAKLNDRLAEWDCGGESPQPVKEKAGQ